MWVGQGKRRDDACNIVVVGAGLVGAAVAAHIAGEGFDTAVLEAQEVAGGATGRSAGMVLTGLPGHYKWAISAYGRPKARDIWGLTVEGRERLIEAAKRMGVPVERSGSLDVAVDEAEAEALEMSAALLAEDGFGVGFEARDPLDRGFHAALSQPDDAVIDPAALTQALLATSGATVHEETEVYSVEPEQDSVRIWAQGRTVFCDAVVLAVDGYASLFDPYFADKVIPARSLVVVTEPLEHVILEQPCSADYGYEYCRQLADRRLLVGGWRRPRVASEGTDKGAELGDVLQEGLGHFAARHFSDLEVQSAERWSGTMGLTRDGLPMVGTLPHLPQVYFAAGLGARGLAWAFVVAERLVQLLLRGTDPEILSAARFP